MNLFRNLLPLGCASMSDNRDCMQSGKRNLVFMTETTLLLPPLIAFAKHTFFRLFLKVLLLLH